MDPCLQPMIHSSLITLCALLVTHSFHLISIHFPFSFFSKSESSVHSIIFFFWILLKINQFLNWHHCHHDLSFLLSLVLKEQWELSRCKQWEGNPRSNHSILNLPSELIIHAWKWTFLSKLKVFFHLEQQSWTSFNSFVIFAFSHFSSGIKFISSLSLHAFLTNPMRSIIWTRS